MRRPIGFILTAVLFIVGLAACSEDRTPTGLVAGGPNAATLPPGGGGGVPHLPGPRYLAITAGNDFTCALTNSNTVYCWGRADSAQVGSTTNQLCSNMIPCVPKPRIVMMQAGDTLRATSIDAGANHVCAIDSQARAWCWGAGGSGQLGFPFGNGPMFANLVPGTSALSFRQISAGSTSTCGTTTNNGIWCWGELPLGVMSSSPFQLTPDLTYTAVTVGAEHRCALKVTAVSSSVDCGGLNNQGQSAVDSVAHPTSATFPTATMFGSNVKDVSAGAYFTCADQRNGTIQCSGSNWHGQLGNGLQAFSNATPQTVGGGMLLHGVTTGRDHACALDNSGNAWCWGNSFWGEVGNDPTNMVYGDFSTPQLVSGGHQFTALAAGGDHTCGTYFNGLIGVNAVYCWGINHFGQLGQGTWTSWFSTPIQVPGF